MKPGLCCSPGDLAGFAGTPFEFIEGHVQRHFVPEAPEKNVAPLLKALTSAPLPMIAANCFLPADLKTTGPATDRSRLANHADVAFRRARKAGLTFIVFGRAGARQVPEGWSLAAGFEQDVEALTIVGPIAAKHRIVVAVEPLHRAEGNLVNTVLEGAVAVARASMPSVKLLVDIFHMLRNGESPDDIVKVGKGIRHAHIAGKEARPAPRVKGDDFRPYPRALKHANYRGALAVECVWGGVHAEAAPGFAELRRQLVDCRL